MNSFSVWQLIAGVGIFLFGIQLLENALRNLLSRRFKLFLRKQTQNKLKAVFGGTVVTAVLQSSSAVNFMVLAFLSTGVITFRNAFAVVMGANLGTTLDSWVVAMLGFKTNIEQFTLPMLGIACLLSVIYYNRQSVRNVALFFVGFGFLFLGLDFMKTSVQVEALKDWISGMSDYGVLFFVFAGFLVTSIVQSSLATVVITLSLLHEKIIGFDSGAALVLGAEVGTTLKIVLASVGGIAAKKRVAYGNLFYNLTTTILVLIFLRTILDFIQSQLGITDLLLGLVIFQTGINLGSILLFLPFINPFSSLLEKLIPESEKSVSAYIKNANPSEPAAAIDLLKKETGFFINDVMLFCIHALGADPLSIKTDKEFLEMNEKKKFDEKTFNEKYDFLKDLHGEIQSFYIRFKDQSLDQHEAAELEQLIASVRSCIYSAKSIKDVQPNTYELSNSSKNVKYRFFVQLRNQAIYFYQQLHEFMSAKTQHSHFEEMAVLLREIQKNYTQALNDFYKDDESKTLSDMEIATLLNFNRELYSSNKALLLAVKDFILEKQQADDFNEIPVQFS